MTPLSTGGFTERGEGDSEEEGRLVELPISPENVFRASKISLSYKNGR